jgi:hypothetical protein
MFMARNVTIAALLALGSMTAACTGAGGNVASASDNRSVGSVHQPVVQRTDYVMDVTADERMSVGERQRLTAWLPESPPNTASSSARARRSPPATSRRARCA